jgi:imidazolonepropionase-like amidohydrolase
MPRPQSPRDRWSFGRGMRRMPFALAILILLSPSTLRAQYEGRVYAITDARLVTLAGEVVEKGTIVLRGGLIESLGAEVVPPADAVVLDGDGLTVYPGFIDAFSQAGLVLPGGNDREYAGNLAHRLATDRFEPDSATLSEFRKQGLTAGLIARSDGVFGGQAVLMNLMGKDVASMTVKAPVVQVMGYQSQRGYPGTLMAVVAHQRQTLIDAMYHDMLITRYREAPRGMARPPAEPDLEALLPVARGRPPFSASSRSRTISNGFATSPGNTALRFWIAGASEAFRVPDLLREAGAPVLVSMNFPAITEVTGYQFDRAYKNLTDEEKKALDERDEQAIHGNAAAVFQAGVPLALATGDMSSPSSFLKNVRLAVEAGLPAEEALKALTLNPATIFGVAEVLGTLEPGKIANLTVTHGDVFTDEDAYVAHVFVDGRKESFEKPKAPAAGGGSGTAAGSWSVSVSWAARPRRGNHGADPGGRGRHGNPLRAGPDAGLRRDNQAGALELAGSIPDMGSVTLSATIEGDRMTGSLSLGPMGSAALTGTRNPGDTAYERRAGR